MHCTLHGTGALFDKQSEKRLEKGEARAQKRPKKKTSFRIDEKKNETRQATPRQRDALSSMNSSSVVMVALAGLALAVLFAGEGPFFWREWRKSNKHAFGCTARLLNSSGRAAVGLTTSRINESCQRAGPLDFYTSLPPGYSFRRGKSPRRARQNLDPGTRGHDSENSFAAAVPGTRQWRQQFNDTVPPPPPL